MQIFSRLSILLMIFNQIWIKNYQIKTNKIFNFSHKISQKRHFVAQKWQFLCEIREFFKKKNVLALLCCKMSIYRNDYQCQCDEKYSLWRQCAS